MLRLIVWIVLLLCPPLALAVDGIEPVESIRAAAQGVAGAQAGIVLDPALRMPRCPRPLQARRKGEGTLEVSCPPTGWRLFVPARIRRDAQVLVLTRNIAAGDIISADMLVQETRDTRRIAGAPLTDATTAIGQTARRALAAGSVLASTHLRAPTAIRRGDQVTLVARQNGIEVRMPGRALGEADIGVRIHAENLSSRRRVQGMVMDNGEVRVQY